MGLSIDTEKNCQLCPRMCGVDRIAGQVGFCGATSQLRISRAALHFWEEPPVSGEAGSGTIFFSSCSLRCVFCQNYAISRGQAGEVVSVSRLAKIMLELQDQGALNINLVTPMHYAPQICEAVGLAKAHGLKLPIVCNTGGYERPEVVRLMGDVVDIWLTDFKYASQSLAKELSYAGDYPQAAAASLKEMVRLIDERGGVKKRDDGSLLQGIIVRHLVLPGHTQDSCDVLDKVFEIAGNNIDVSIMNQYTPNKQCLESGTSLGRKLSETEYDKVLTYAEDLGFNKIWWQEEGTASESFIPEFDTTGVEGPEL